MDESSLLVAHPEVSDQLVLLFHGVGSSAQDLAPVSQALAQARPRATVVSVEAPHPSQLGRGIDARALQHVPNYQLKP